MFWSLLLFFLKEWTNRVSVNFYFKYWFFSPKILLFLWFLNFFSVGGQSFRGWMHARQSVKVRSASCCTASSASSPGRWFKVFTGLFLFLSADTDLPKNISKSWVHCYLYNHSVYVFFIKLSDKVRTFLMFFTGRFSFKSHDMIPLHYTLEGSIYAHISLSN